MIDSAISYTIDGIADVAAQIVDQAKGNRIFLFYGDMGAGKTTLIKSLCAYLGITEPVTSPTFAIVNEYQGEKAHAYHFDFYRLKNQTEALDMGYEEYFYSDAWCFIEWPEKIPSLLPEHFTKIEISITGADSRLVNIQNF